MTSLSLSDMGIDLTSELASLLKLSVSDKWFIGKSFIDEFSGAIILNDIQKLKSLSETYHHIDYPQPESWLCLYEETVLSVFNAIKKKLFPICSLSVLIGWLEIELEYSGWGSVFIDEFKALQKKGIEYINPDFHPFKYAEEGMPLIEHWLKKELINNNCPFITANAIDYFFEFVERVRDIQSNSIDTEIYCFISNGKGLRIIDRKRDIVIR